MATKKGKKPKGKKIKVTKARKKPKASKKRKRGRGQYSNFFPTNRTIDSNQYWQLRAEIAGAEARVRTGLRDQKDDESKAKKKAEKKVDTLAKEVAAVSRDVTRTPWAQRAASLAFTPSDIAQRYTPPDRRSLSPGTQDTKSALSAFAPAAGLWTKRSQGRGGWD